MITANGICKSFADKQVLSGIDLDIKPGTIFGLLGPSGAGKTTLMKTLLGLKEPVGGQIIRGDGLRRNEIGYLPQSTDVQKDFPASVTEIVLSGCQGRCGRRPFYNKFEKSLAQENMERLGISHLASRCFSELSGGQQQRVLLARALCATRKVLLLDEPAAGLDPDATEQMYSLIKELNDEGVTIIMISHDIGSVNKYASRILRVGGDAA